MLNNPLLCRSNKGQRKPQEIKIRVGIPVAIYPRVEIREFKNNFELAISLPNDAA